MPGSEPADRPLVSMVMVTNRYLPYLEQSLASIAVQTYRELEIIVVDDGSPETERLQEMIKRFPVRYVRQEASGVSVGRNNGVRLARGEYVGFFDDDDHYPSEWVAEHVLHFQEHPEVVLTYARIRSIDGAGTVLTDEPLRPTDVHDIYRRDISILTGSMVVRREVFLRSGGFHPLLCNAQDLDLVLRLALQGPFGYVPGTFRDYRTHEVNATRNYRNLVRYIRSINGMYRKVLTVADRPDLVHDLWLSDLANDRYAAWRAINAARELLRKGAVLDAAREIGWVVRFAPWAPASAVAKRLRRRRPARR